ncbi:hypothetical protein [Leucobacter coleopterorum]|uniref:hypothetical protein n=1 Tax=Leucobacter coleopterorum TaxID=2714933 RepID=UPI001FCC33CF|nr:hypothetical protein [Leucobacter coleopterorum]
MSATTATTRIPGIVSGLRQGFQQGVTRPEKWRRDQLRRLRSLLVDRGVEFERALFEDLGKSGTESQLTEIGFLVSEIDYVLAHLSKWMRPRRVGVPLRCCPLPRRLFLSRSVLR